MTTIGICQYEGWNTVGLDTPIVGGYAGMNGPPRQYGVTVRLKF